MLSADKESHHYQVNVISRQGKSPLSGECYQQTRIVITIRLMLSADKEGHQYHINVISRQEVITIRQMLSADKEGHQYHINVISRQGKASLSDKCYQQARKVITIKQILFYLDVKSSLVGIVEKIHTNF